MSDFARAALLAVAAVLVVAAGKVQDARAQDADAPLEITAQDALEWRRNDNTLIAEGDVVVTRGTVRLQADRVSAYYRDTKASGAEEKQEVYRVDAVGHVRIDTEDARAYGDSAAYDLDQAVFVLTGGTPRFVAADLTVTAAENLEYWQDRQLAVARGKAVASSGDRRIAADVLSAYVRSGHDGATELQKVEAFGAVSITTPVERASGEQAVYDADTGVATLCGNVEIRRGDNSLKGDCAEFNLNTGVSRLLGGGGGIRGLVRPED